MDAPTKAQFKAQLMGLTAVNTAFKSAMSIPPQPAMGGMPPMPIMLQPTLAPYLGALKQHADEFDKLIKIVGEIVDKS